MATDVPLAMFTVSLSSFAMTKRSVTVANLPHFAPEDTYARRCAESRATFVGYY